jgi:hypothetical protein
VVEARGPAQGFKRSAVLARGNRRQILATIGLLDIGLTVGSIGLAMSYADSQTSHGPIWMSLVSWAFAVVYLPYHGVLSSALYANARVRNEGYDVEEQLFATAGAA